MVEKPKSASNLATGFSGLVAGILTGFLVTGWDQPVHFKTLAVVVVTGLAMAQFDRLIQGREPANAARPADWPRVLRKLLGLWSTIGIVAAAYWLLPEYAKELYQPFFAASTIVVPALAVVSPFYVLYVDRRMDEPEDAYSTIGDVLLGRGEIRMDLLQPHVLGWLVKGFFLPLMFGFVTDDLERLWSGELNFAFGNFEQFYRLTYDTLFLFDVLIASVGYLCTLRILDGHIRSTEPTVLGWVACLACYPPFWIMISSNYLTYEVDDFYWGNAFSSIPALYIAWGTLILALLTVYVAATLSFGFRFSNLTNRGIITSGPYRWVKHPAYLTKNLSWWLVSIPFVSSQSWEVALQSSLLLFGVNLIYGVRAFTEERHLARDPAYREYQAFIAEHGLWAHIRRLARFGQGPSRSATR